MIKINLLSGRRKVTRQSRGEQTVLIGAGIVAALGAVVFFAVHQPKSEAVAAQKKTNSEITAQNKKVEDKIKGLDSLRSAIKAAEDQKAAIERLNAARAVPAWFLYELSQLLTPGGAPSITEAMAKELENNPNRKWQAAWDPTHVWIKKISEKEGVFTLEGGAQSDSDVTQLALRLQASMFFDDVQPSKADVTTDKTSNISYYTFVITGKVRY